jgi:hypothetical protein
MVVRNARLSQSAMMTRVETTAESTVVANQQINPIVTLDVFLTQRVYTTSSDGGTSGGFSAFYCLRSIKCFPAKINFHFSKTPFSKPTTSSDDSVD